MKQFLSFVRKEFYHIFRDKRTMVMMLGMPVILIILFGFAITTEIQRVPIAVLDQSKDDATRRIIQHIKASEYFDLYAMVNDKEEGEALFRKGKVRMIIVFPPQFNESMVHNKGVQMQLIADATDPNEATSLTQYVQSIVADAIQTFLSPAEINSGEAYNLQIVPEITLLYNPQMKGAYNFVPGVMGLILILICAMMTSVGIVREKEMGTMEILLVSPMKPIYIILAKAVPYLLLSMANVITILLLSYYLLEVPIAGSLTLLFSLCMLYAMLSLSLGLLISTITDTQQAAMLVSAMALMLPIMLLSGMMFPVENMPWILQLLSNIVPAKWFIVALKDVMIKGLGIEIILKEVAVLVGMTVVLIVVSVARFKNRLE